MNVRGRIHRSGVALAVMGLVLATVDVNPAGEIPGAYAEEAAAAAAASPQPSASPQAVASPHAVAAESVAAPAVAQPESAGVSIPAKGPEGGDLTHLTFTATDGLNASLVSPGDDGVAAGTTTSIEVKTVLGAGVELKIGDAVVPFSRIGKQYGRQILFVDASFQLNPGEKVGLVGPNGSGKTTLFRMIVGEETADEGEVSVPKKLTIGYFRQDVEEMAGRSVLDEAIAGSGRLGSLHHELEDLQHGMADPGRAADMGAILARFGEVQEEYEHLGGYALENRTREILLGLGFDDERIDERRGDRS